MSVSERFWSSICQVNRWPLKLQSRWIPRGNPIIIDCLRDETLLIQAKRHLGLLLLPFSLRLESTRQALGSALLAWWCNGLAPLPWGSPTAWSSGDCCTLSRTWEVPVPFLFGILSCLLVARLGSVQNLPLQQPQDSILLPTDSIENQDFLSPLLATGVSCCIKFPILGLLYDESLPGHAFSKSS